MPPRKSTQPKRSRTGSSQGSQAQAKKKKKPKPNMLVPSSQNEDQRQRNEASTSTTSVPADRRQPEARTRGSSSSTARERSSSTARERSSSTARERNAGLEVEDDPEQLVQYLLQGLEDEILQTPPQPDGEDVPNVVPQVANANEPEEHVEDLFAVSDLDRAYNAPELASALLFGQARVIIPTANERQWSREHPHARKKVPPRHVQELRTLYEANGLHRLQFRFIISTPPDNIENVETIDGHKLDSSNPDSLTRYVRFIDPTKVLFVHGYIRSLAALEFYLHHHLGHRTWWYCDIYLTDDLMAPEHLALYEWLATNNQPGPRPATAGEIWAQAVGYRDGADGNAERRDALVSKQFLKHPKALRCFKDQEFADACTRLFQWPHWNSLTSFNSIAELWNNECKDMFIRYIWGANAFLDDPQQFRFLDNPYTRTMVDYPELKDWRLFKAFTQAWETWLDMVIEYINAEDKQMVEVPTSYTEHLMTTLRHIYLSDEPNGYAVPRAHKVWAEPFLENLERYLAKFPATVFMTPRTTGSMVAYHRQFDTIWMEVNESPPQLQL
ncbi:hypothetical protein CALVIDRAFT_567298 [Calocera viscosa TUFC12733]|uniref:Uncharacterized protein n=1 Tax=Calocera viscosa (strain TUFC12733) TaxID=1330018 RepID=A0A167IGP9_CALVF|nr:hypothetical protein CALVIDRAFT_567298 [Calocera viscosa TUFC12733]